MNKNIISIGIVSKGRLLSDSKNLLKKKKLHIYSERGERELLGKVKGKPNLAVYFYHARELLDQLATGNLDVAISGLDLLKESDINIQKNIKIEKKLNFGFANLVLAVREEFIDVFTTLDLDEVAEDYLKKNKKLIRIGTKYPTLTKNFLFERGVTNFTCVKSLGSTELMPAVNSSTLVSDIVSSGITMIQNKLRPLNDGLILKSQACLFSSKKSKKKRGIKNIIKLLSR
jgi:ATP phosphoribosyltransferase